jgi:hypothetical protein
MLESFKKVADIITVAIKFSQSQIDMTNDLVLKDFLKVEHLQILSKRSRLENWSNLNYSSTPKPSYRSKNSELPQSEMNKPWKTRHF